MPLWTTRQRLLATCVQGVRKPVRQGLWVRKVWGIGFWVVLGVCLALAPSTYAESSRPEVASLQGAKPTQPVRLSVWGFEVYDARLWSPAAFRYAQYAEHAFALELQYLRRLEGAAIASSSLTEMRRVGSFTDAQAQSWGAALRAIFPNIGPGERITGVNLPGVGVEFWVNGQRVGSVTDPVFARLFFGIWLSERTSEPQLRTKLLRGLAP